MTDLLNMPFNLITESTRDGERMQRALDVKRKRVEQAKRAQQELFTTATEGRG